MAQKNAVDRLKTTLLGYVQEKQLTEHYEERHTEGETNGGQRERRV